MKVANKNCREYVERREEFNGSNLYGVWERGVYVVYSYGRHFPLLVCKGNTWYFNESKYSQSTSRHLSQSRPDTYDSSVVPVWLPAKVMRGFVN